MEKALNLVRETKIYTEIIGKSWQMDLVILTDLQLFLPGNAIKQEALAGQKVVLTSGPQKCKAKEQEILLLVIIAME